MTNQTLYNTSEFELWSDRKGLLVQEHYFLTKYITALECSILEAGTGGGRISCELENLGFKNITAFDYVKKMIEAAKANHSHSHINFFVADATDLSALQSNTFDRLIYLQQIISFIPKQAISKAFSEAYRITKPDGIVIFSFLNWRGRKINPLLSYLLSVVRFFRHETQCKQCLPWLKYNNHPNWKLFSKNQPTTYWFTQEELISTLKNFGFTILEIKTSSYFTGASSDGMLYIVAQKKGIQS